MKDIYFEKIERYLKLIESFESRSQFFEPLLHPDFIQVELPNLLNKKGQTSKRSEIFDRLESSKKILVKQSFKIESYIEKGDRAAAEAVWEGTMAIDLGSLKKGQTLKAFFCMVFEFKEGKIIKQKNYDCFEAF